MFEGSEIRKKRKKEGRSVKELADLLGITNPGNIFKWEKGHKPQDPEDFLKIEKWLGEKLENVPPETSNGGGIKSGEDKYIKLLEDNDRFFKQRLSSEMDRMLFLESTTVAYLKTVIEWSAEKESNGDEVLKDKIIAEKGKRVAFYLGSGIEKGNPGV